MRLENEADPASAESGQRLALQLQDILPVHDERPAVRRGQRSEDLQERGLAGARRTHDGHDFMRVGAEIDSLQDLQGPETLPNIAGFDDHGSKVAIIY